MRRSRPAASELWSAYKALISAEVRDALPDAHVRAYGDRAAVKLTYDHWLFALERQRLTEGSYTWRLSVIAAVNGATGDGYRFIEDDDDASHVLLLGLAALVKENRL